MSMLQKIILAVLTAFVLGLLGETAVIIYNLVTGATNELATLIEVGIAWLVVLVTSYMSVWHSVTHRNW